LNNSLDLDNKGLDDLIAECGVEALFLAITNCEPLTGEPPNFKQKPSPNSIAEKIAKELAGKVLYDVSGKMWRCRDIDRIKVDRLMEELKAEEKASGISSTNSSSTELESFIPPVTKQHPIAQPSPNDEEILPKGTKVHCERIDKDAVVYSSRRKEFKKPNGTTEVVLQYYVDLGGEVYKWFDWDLLVAV
jgi:hypothetical protein